MGECRKLTVKRIREYNLIVEGSLKKNTECEWNRVESSLASNRIVEPRLKVTSMKWIDENQALSLGRILPSLKVFPVDLPKIHPRSLCHKSGLGFELVLERIIGLCWCPTLRNV